MRHVRFVGSVESMCRTSIRAHDQRRGLHSHEEALKVFVSVARFSQHDLEGLKLQRKLSGPPKMILLCPVEVPQ
jgi:hypothetical protein